MSLISCTSQAYWCCVLLFSILSIFCWTNWCDEFRLAPSLTIPGTFASESLMPLGVASKPVATSWKCSKFTSLLSIYQILYQQWRRAHIIYPFLTWWRGGEVGFETTVTLSTLFEETPDATLEKCREKSKKKVWVNANSMTIWQVLNGKNQNGLSDSELTISVAVLQFGAMSSISYWHNFRQKQVRAISQVFVWSWVKQEHNEDWTNIVCEPWCYFSKFYLFAECRVLLMKFRDWWC